MFIAFICSIALADDEIVTPEELGVDGIVLSQVVEDPVRTAQTLTALDGMLDDAARRVAASEARTQAEKVKREKAEAEIDALRVEVAALKATKPVPVSSDRSAAAADTRELEASIDQLAKRLEKLGVPEKIPVAAVARVAQAQEPRTVVAPVAPMNPCLAMGWIVGSLDDPNVYTPSGSARCHSDKNPKSLKFRNESSDYGYVLVVNGMLVVPQIHGQTVVSIASGIPRELTAAAMPGGLTGLPIIPPGSTLYGAVPSLTGTWRMYRFVRDPIAGTYELDEACKPREYSRSGYSVDWEEAIGDGMGYCDS